MYLYCLAERTAYLGESPGWRCFQVVKLSLWWLI